MREIMSKTEKLMQRYKGTKIFTLWPILRVSLFLFRLFTIYLLTKKVDQGDSPAITPVFSLTPSPVLSLPGITAPSSSSSSEFSLSKEIW